MEKNSKILKGEQHQILPKTENNENCYTSWGGGSPNGITILENGLEISDTVRHNTDEPEIPDTTNKNLCLPEDIFRDPQAASSFKGQNWKLFALSPTERRVYKLLGIYIMG